MMKYWLLCCLLLGLQGNTFRKNTEIKEIRLALLIGNKDYKEGAKLTNPLNDVDAMAKTLDSVGFVTYPHKNLTGRGMHDAVTAFEAEIKKQKCSSCHVTALFYYSGHGLAYKATLQASPENYLIPVDAMFEKFYPNQSYMARSISESLEGADMRILLFDACRSKVSPFKTAVNKDIPDVGYYRMELVKKDTGTPPDMPKGTYIQYATAFESSSLDVIGNSTNSPYVLGFVKAMQQYAKAESATFFKKVKEEVFTLTSETQKPAIQDDMIGDFYFKKPTENKPVVVLPTEKKEEPKKETTENKPPLPTDLPRNMVFIQGGTFLMGSSENEVVGENDEKQHSVTLNSFYMSKYEVTVGEFKKFIQSTKYQTDAEKEGFSRVYKNGRWQEEKGLNWRHDTKGDVRPKSEYTHPVIYVSWNDAKAYCAWLVQTTGKPYSLPTEAQWEYACRAGKATPFSTGNNLTTDQANYDGNYPYNGNAEGAYRQTTLPVGSFKPNTWRLYDMHGNVCEWCEDWYAVDFYDTVEATKPNPINTKENDNRVLRGGSWASPAEGCRSAFRNNPKPTNRTFNLGFRVVSF